jgi:hypothetical protein
MIEWFMSQLHAYWVIFGIKVLGYKYALPYVPNKHNDLVMAITFSYREDYINKICQAIDGKWPEWTKDLKEGESNGDT